MTTDLITVGEDEPIDLVARLMDWHHIHHIPVEDERHRLLGLVSHRSLLRFLASRRNGEEEAPAPVTSWAGWRRWRPRWEPSCQRFETGPGRRAGVDPAAVCAAAIPEGAARAAGPPTEGNRAP